MEITLESTQLVVLVALDEILMLLIPGSLMHAVGNDLSGAAPLKNTISMLWPVAVLRGTNISPTAL